MELALVGLSVGRERSASSERSWVAESVAVVMLMWVVCPRECRRLWAEGPPLRPVAKGTEGKGLDGIPDMALDLSGDVVQRSGQSGQDREVGGSKDTYHMLAPGDGNAATENNGKTAKQ